jgi:pimeloyl-ACP methyl ester carboxylesterase
VVWGSEDAWIPVDRASRLADAIPHAQLEIIGGAGHLVQLDQPARLAMTLQRWLEGQRRVL